MSGWVDGVRTLQGEGRARLAGMVDGARSFGREQAARILGWGGPEVDERAKMLGRMVGFVVRGLRTKSYEQFVVAFSNPGREPDALKRLSRKTNFQLRISPTCWYDADVSYGRDGSRSLRILGGGDDFGVRMTAGSTDDDVRVELLTDYSDRPGRDARAIVRALARMPGYRRIKSAPLEI
jgi:hypothetical protein